MELMCEDCGTMMQIPAERVPQNSTFRVTCPRCKRKISASTKSSEGASGGETNGAPSESLISDGVETDNSDNGLPAPAPSPLSSNHPAALLCVAQNDRRADYRSSIESVGFVTDAPTTPDQALQHIRFNQYALIVVEDMFGERLPNPVTSYLAELNMNIRRDILVILVGERLKTGDPLGAFLARLCTLQCEEQTACARRKRSDRGILTRSEASGDVE
jgi:hypothetical protein